MKVQLTEKQKRFFTAMQSKQYDVVTYLDLLDIYRILESLDCYAWSLCVHDKEEDLINVDGMFKKVHTHIVIIFENRVRGSRLVRLFNSTEVRNIITNKQLVGSYLYLTHESEKAIREKKVKYEKSKRQYYNEQFFLSIEDYQSTNTALDIIDSIISGCSYRELVARYGREFVYHYKHYVDIAQKIEIEQRNKVVQLVQGDFDFENK